MREKIRNLITAIIDNESSSDLAEHTIAFVYNALGRLLDYSRIVVEQGIETDINQALWNSGNLDGDELKRRTTEKDSERTNIHNIVIQSCRQLNRLCKKYGVENICPATDDRYEIAVFVGQFIQELFQDGIGGSY